MDAEAVKGRQRFVSQSVSVLELSAPTQMINRQKKASSFRCSHTCIVFRSESNLCLSAVDCRSLRVI